MPRRERSVTTTVLRANWTEILRLVVVDGERVLLERYGHVDAAIVSREELERLRAFEATHG